ncbi:type-F conjugative transfer system pilin assembly protein TrbC (plasmid) [Gemmobacter fulvus]|uniref:Type-F conjugative transfer system pilin assembly protein TrbC n=1 Tax=Gemmobacter fulvus TaxID=2840474 RepID=A0A975PD86_9RHOB|nr:type-F conjugative transfer system pilin assembly protein TrbC [Gemmobacter fulvus]MBT9247954.1 type-F conjugative transfer system pilin assembly protein TrbC [Gemmobacter fulvus]QWK93011.1 type-F conjugative transfer system pilin assembly protein TrbC [Gemmobacter fulvus]
MLRTLISTCLTACTLGLPALAEAQDTDQAPRFAPGALGPVGVDVEILRQQSLRDAETLRGTLETQDPADLSAMSPGIEALQDQAMNDPRIRALLGVDDPARMSGSVRPDHSAAKVLVFASFGMPDASLRQVMQDAERYQGQVVFRGFVGNSVFETEAALTRVFGKLETATAFAIDPTLFTRFNVHAVPVYVVLNGPLDVCETPGCVGDVVPPHDRISGNITLDAALSIAAHGRGDAGQVAKSLLAAAPQTPEGGQP